MNYSIKTFGCKVNTYDSALIQKSLSQKAGLLPGPVLERDKKGGPKALHIVNTCAVTEEAVKEALRHIRRYKAKHPESSVVVTGCATQVETEKFSSLEEVDLVVANSHKAHLTDILTDKFGEKGPGEKIPSEKIPSEKIPSQKVFKSSIFKKSDLGQQAHLERGHTRLFLKIQDGCDGFCTFCIIPFARGKSRSLPLPELVRSVQEHYDQGVREVVLTGVHIGDYTSQGKNPPLDSEQSGQSQQGLAHLLRALLEETKMPRLRLSSLEPPELSQELLDLFTESRVCSHFHLSIQSAHSEILKRMKRKYQAKDVKNTLMKINKKIPEAFVGMDLITGFAEESQKQFEDTYLRLKDWPWTRLHVFPYSPRRYTYAEKAYTSHPRSLIMKRASQLRHLSQARFKEALLSQKGTVQKVLPLQHKERMGLSRNYWNVLLPADRGPVDKAGELTLQIRSIHEQKGHLLGGLI